MKIINEPSNHNINDYMEYSATPMEKKDITDKIPHSFVIKTKELEEETYCCFVRGYN